MKQFYAILETPSPLLTLLVFIAVAVGVAILGALTLWIIRRYPMESVKSRGDALAKEIEALRNQVTILLNDRIRDQVVIENLRVELGETRKQLAVANVRIMELEARVKAESPKPARARRQTKAEIVKPLLAILGNNIELAQRDTAAITRTGIQFELKRNATAQEVTEEFRRRRMDGNLYPWVVISSDSNDDGIMLDKMLGPQFWQETLKGVSIVMLSSCRTSLIADELVGVVGFIVYFSDDAPIRETADFIDSFWSRVAQGIAPLRAFAESLTVVPAVSTFVNYRKKQIHEVEKE